MVVRIIQRQAAHRPLSCSNILMPATSSSHITIVVSKWKPLSRDRPQTIVIPFSILPVPNLSQEMFHVDFFAVHLHHPRMFEHAPWGRSSRWFLFQTAPPLIPASYHIIEIQGSCAKQSTYQHSMKYLKFSLHLIPFSSSSFNFGIVCLTM